MQLMKPGQDWFHFSYLQSKYKTFELFSHFLRVILEAPEADSLKIEVLALQSQVIKARVLAYTEFVYPFTHAPQLLRYDFEMKEL